MPPGNEADNQVERTQAPLRVFCRANCSVRQEVRGSVSPKCARSSRGAAGSPREGQDPLSLACGGEGYRASSTACQPWVHRLALNRVPLPSQQAGRALAGSPCR
jgi:hypothetical protein